MADVIKKIYEIQNIGKGVINNITADNLLLVTDSNQGVQGIENVLDTNNVLNSGSKNIVLTEGSSLGVLSQTVSDLSGVFTVANNGFLLPNVVLANFGKNQNSNFSGLRVWDNKMEIVDQLLKGLEYPADYSPNFTNFSLITKKYVDDRTTGSQTKLNPGTNVTITGNGTQATPYVINSVGGGDGSQTKMINGNGTVIGGNGTLASPYTVNLLAPDTTKVFRGLITQVGTDNPQVTTMKNTTGGDIVSIIRTAKGDYTMSVSFTLTSLRTTCRIQSNMPNISIYMLRTGESTITLKTRTTNGDLVTDDALAATPFEILIDSIVI